MEKKRVSINYGYSIINPNGTPENITKCIETVYSPNNFRGMIGEQCKRKRGYGPEKEWCKQHAKQFKED